MRKTRVAWLAVAALAVMVWAQPAAATAQARSSIGVQVEDVRSGAGAEIRAVLPNSPAQRAGFMAGDIVVEFDGERVRSAAHLSRLVQETATGREVSAVIT